MQFVRRIVCCALLFLLHACGGESSSPPPENQKPGGIYAGNFTLTNPERIREVTGVVFEDGDAFFFADDAMLRTVILPSGDGISSPLDAYAKFGTTWDGSKTLRTGTISGDLVERESMSGTFSLSNEGSGTFELDYLDATHPTLNPSSQYIGTYSASNIETGYSISITLGSQLRVDGQDSNNCTIAGNWKVPDSRYNAAELSNMTFTCPDAELSDGSGAAYLTPNAENPQEIVYGVRYRIMDGGPVDETVVSISGKLAKN